MPPAETHDYRLTQLEERVGAVEKDVKEIKQTIGQRFDRFEQHLDRQDEDHKKIDETVGDIHESVVGSLDGEQPGLNNRVKVIETYVAGQQKAADDEKASAGSTWSNIVSAVINGVALAMMTSLLGIVGWMVMKLVQSK